METPGNYNITGFEDFGWNLREQKHAALVSCIPVLTDNLTAAGYELAEFFLALSIHCDRLGYSQSVVKNLENLSQDFEKK